MTIPFAELLIGETALELGFSVLTVNLRDFWLIPASGSSSFSWGYRPLLAAPGIVSPVILFVKWMWRKPAGGGNRKLNSALGCTGVSVTFCAGPESDGRIVYSESPASKSDE